jgi:cysteine synthase A
MKTSFSACAATAGVDGVLGTIGRTPLVRLERVCRDAPFSLFAKLERANPGGSAKDRAALQMILEGRQSGAIGPGTTIVESSSGNMALGLAQVCRYFGLRFVCVVDHKTTGTHLKILRALGAEIDCVDGPDPVSGEYLPARLRRVQQIVATTSDAYWPNQYANQGNLRAHYLTTMPEIVAALGHVDYLFCATSTCGTLAGCSQYVRDQRLETTLVAVDAVGSVLFSSCKQPRILPGHGAAIRPPLRDNLGDVRCVHVTDWDCVVGCRRLAHREAILAGGSSGGVISAVERLKPQIEPGAVCVAILHDHGERYLDTVYSDEWVSAQFGRDPEEARDA